MKSHTTDEEHPSDLTTGCFWCVFETAHIGFCFIQVHSNFHCNNLVSFHLDHAFHKHISRRAGSHSFSGFRHQVDTVDWNLAEGDVSSKRVHCDPWKMGIHTRILGKHQSCKSIAQTNKHQICFMRQLHVLRVKTSGSYEGIQWSRLLFYSECLVCFGDSCSESSLEHLTL